MDPSPVFEMYRLTVPTAGPPHAIMYRLTQNPDFVSHMRKVTAGATKLALHDIIVLYEIV